MGGGTGVSEFLYYKSDNDFLNKESKFKIKRKKNGGGGGGEGLGVSYFFLLRIQI